MYLYSSFYYCMYFVNKFRFLDYILHVFIIICIQERISMHSNISSVYQKHLLYKKFHHNNDIISLENSSSENVHCAALHILFQSK